MRTKIVVLLFILFTSHVQAKNILIIGDSHTVGPFGQGLFNLLKKTNHNTALYAHSSSAAYHWMSLKSYKLSGGAYHALKKNNQEFFYPFPSDWRVKLDTIKFDSLSQNMLYHPAWKDPAKEMKADLVVVALGANDYNAVTTEAGNFNQNGYKIREKAVAQMLSVIDKIGAKCLWVLPPDGIKKDSKRQKLLYTFLENSIQNRCEVYNSMKYKTTGCDGVHFSCPSQSGKARAWAKEVSTEVLRIL